MSKTIAQAEIQMPAIVPAPSTALTPMDMLDRAVASGASVEVLGKLMELQERWESNQARKAFDEAMATAKAEIPVIFKNREVDFTSSKGRTHYRHEDMAGIAKIVDPILAKNGLSYRYRTSSVPNEPVVVTCIMSHRLGHSEETTLMGGRDETGNKNSLQAVGSTVTYLQRYTLKAALGLAASDDDDGHYAAEDEKITQEQCDRLVAMVNEVGADMGRFCKFLKVDGLPELPAARYADAVAALESRRNRVAP